MNRKILMLSLCVSQNVVASMRPITDGLNSAASSAQEVFKAHPYLCSAAAAAAGTAVTATWLMWPKAEKKSSSGVVAAKRPEENLHKEVTHSPVDEEEFFAAQSDEDGLSVKGAVGSLTFVAPRDERRVSFAESDDQDQLDQEGILARCEAAVKTVADDEVAKQLEMLLLTSKVLEKVNLRQASPLVSEQKTSSHANGALYWTFNGGKGDLMSHIVRLAPREAEDLCRMLNASLLGGGAVSGVTLKPLMSKLGFGFVVKQEISVVLLVKRMQLLLTPFSSEA